MLLNESNPVLRDVIEKCDAAFRAGSPLIFLDTQERELAVSAVIRARDDELVSLTKRPAAPDPRQRLYYEFVGAPPEDFDRYTNLFFEPEKLAPGRGDDSMDASVPAFAAVIQLLPQDQDTVQALRDYVRDRVDTVNTASRLSNSLVLLYGDPSLIPVDLQPYTTVVSVKYPTQAEICRQLMDTAEAAGHPFEAAEDAQPLAAELTGFGVMEVERMANKLLQGPLVEGHLPIHHPRKRIRVAREEKKQALTRHQGLLDLMEDKEKDKDKDKDDGADPAPGDDADRLVGMGAYKEWAEQMGRHMRDASGYAVRYGLMPPKGVLLCGVPGCGKSEAARILQRDWRLSMVRLNVDALMGSKVGESERNMRQALRLAEAMAPCILFIDELEKAFSGSSSKAGEGDGGTFKRMFGRILAWMQDNKKPVFIIATANDIDGLPKEFFRSGRFDALFSVFMPCASECCQLFAEQMKRANNVRREEAKNRGVHPVDLFEKECFDPEKLTALLDFFVPDADVEKPQNAKFASGADIAKITHMALLYAGEQGWCNENRSIKPLEWRDAVAHVLQGSTLVTQGGTDAGLRDIAKVYMRLFRGNFVPASSPMNVLYSKRNFQTREENGKLVCRVIRDIAPETPSTETPPDETPWRYEDAHKYDKALFNALKPYLERMGTQLARLDEDMLQ